MVSESLIEYALLLAKGGMITLVLWFFTATISLAIGSLFGILNSDHFEGSIVSIFIKMYVQLMKGVPLYVLLLINCFVLPPMLNIKLPVIVIATLTLGLSSAAYIAEIMRSGLNGISAGQWEACTVLGYNNINALWRVILPQVLKNCIPGIIGELDQQIKSTSLFATIGVIELTKSAMLVIEDNVNPLPVYLVIASFYFIISCLINYLGKKIERKPSK